MKTALNGSDNRRDRISNYLRYTLEVVQAMDPSQYETSENRIEALELRIRRLEHLCGQGLSDTRAEYAAAKLEFDDGSG